jgi:hypothetical protein
MYRVTPEGEYKELKYVATNLTSDTSILILDEDTMKIWVFNGEKVPAMIKYKAGMASSTLNAKNGLKYRITHVEIAEYEKKALQLFSDYEKQREAIHPGLEADAHHGLSNATVSRLGAVPRLDEKYSEDDKTGKAKPVVKAEPTKSTIPEVVEKKEVPKAKPKTKPKDKVDFGVEVAKPPIPDSLSTAQSKETAPLTDSILEAVAQQILHDSQLDRIQREALPPKVELKKQLIKQIDDLLDELYT